MEGLRTHIFRLGGLLVLALLLLFPAQEIKAQLFAPQEDQPAQKPARAETPAPATGSGAGQAAASGDGGWWSDSDSPDGAIPGSNPGYYGGETLTASAGPSGPASQAPLGRPILAPSPGEEGFFAPPPPPPPPPPKPVKRSKNADLMVEEFSYYMFKDDKGVINLTDAPTDPRFRLITIQITISRGLAPYRRLNLEKVRPYIMTAAQRYRLDPALIASVIKAESAFDPKAVSWAGARGLMQLMPNTALLMGVKDSFDPEQNIMGGSRYLREMLNRFNGDLTLAIAAYNCGPERVAKVGRIPDIQETKNYVKIVLANLRIMEPLFADNPGDGYAERVPDSYSATVSFPDPGASVSSHIAQNDSALMAPGPERLSRAPSY